MLVIVSMPRRHRRDETQIKHERSLKTLGARCRSRNPAARPMRANEARIDVMYHVRFQERRTGTYEDQVIQAVPGRRSAASGALL